ncbi:MAG: radical SAM protein [Proteobacteria bacterium]|nr:radical SAM protein [Pseudomonadota bacterium]
MAPAAEAPFLVALNLTRRCNLACAHCYLDAGTRRAGTGAELATAEVAAVLDGIASLGGETMVVLTGGEPLLRPDLEAIACHAVGLGLMVVVGTNGTVLDARRVAALIEAGVAGVGISLDSLDPAYHDGFRGRPGAWARTMTAIDACRQGGLAFQIHFSVTNRNAAELEAMIAFARSAGALALNVFFLVCTGRGERFANVSSGTYDDVLRRVTRAAHEETRLLVRAKCAPHFKRMAMELDPSWPITLAHGYEAGGCLAGTRYCRVTPEGEVTACPYIETPAGSVRTTPFADIWRDAPMFCRLRAPRLDGRCGCCEYRKICGGCRARPLARSGALMGEDFLCSYRPQGGSVIEPLHDATGDISWTAEAESRLARVPPFLRRMVRKRIEDAARRRGRGTVTADDLQASMPRRFVGAGPPPGVGRFPGRWGGDA